MKAKAVITTKWDKKTYRPHTLDQVESFFVETAIDSDSDSFQVQIGDPEHNLIECLRRDSEVRVQLWGIGYGAKKMFTGLADTIVFDETGVLTIEGRDMSCLAVDSTMPPQLWRQVKASILIPKQAKQLGMKGPFYVTTRGVVKKLQYTDASETYWDFWYRLVRKDQMFIWTGPDGSLSTGPLNYNKPPAYGFGRKPKKGSFPGIKEWIDVETLEFRTSKQGRISEIWVFGHRGDNGLPPAKIRDPEIADWIRKPLKVMMDTDAHNQESAAKMGREEIFESKVGAEEIRILVSDPGYVIKQNNMAHVNVPSMGVEGDYFVVGSRIQASSSGFMQEVRLREKNYAISKRVPEDPKIADQPGKKQTTTLGAALKNRWGNFFVKAAQKWHGGWDFSMFLACLLGMCHQETGFANVNQGGHTEWFPAPDSPQSQHGHGEENIRTHEEWASLFRNHAETSGYEHGVGPMQLTSRGYKYEADDLMKTGFRNELEGGRWHPEHNIMVAAHAFRSKLQAVTRDSFRDIDIWLGVKAYNGSGPAAEAYMLKVKNYVMNDPGYLQQVKDAQKENEERVPAGLNDKRAAMLKYIKAAEANEEHWHYDRGGAAGRSSFPNPSAASISTDCSGYTACVYHAAGISIPAQSDAQGAHGTRLHGGPYLVGDLCIYPDHVTVVKVAGNYENAVISSHGQESGPRAYRGVDYRGDLSYVVRILSD